MVDTHDGMCGGLAEGGGDELTFSRLYMETKAPEWIARTRDGQDKCIEQISTTATSRRLSKRGSRLIFLAQMPSLSNFSLDVSRIFTAQSCHSQ